MHGGGRRGKATFPPPPFNLTKRQKCSSNFVTDCSIEGSESSNDVRFLIGEECSKLALSIANRHPMISLEFLHCGEDFETFGYIRPSDQPLKVPRQT